MSITRCAVALALVAAPAARAQAHDHEMSAESMNGEHHMEMTALRHGTAADSARAAGVAALLRDALKPYADTTAAVAAGYRMFMPQNRKQKVYHFTSNRNALKELFRFDPAQPTSLLYKQGADGRLKLVGAMYTAPKRFGPDQLDARVPLSVAQWHKHVNWCIPAKSETARWTEQKNGHSVFGPASPIDTKGGCDAAGGVFHDTVFGWMLHANVFAGNDPKAIWADDHGGHDTHDGMMKMGMDP